MGNCVLNTQRSEKEDTLATYPEDIIQYSPENHPNLPMMKFEGLLYNIKVTRCPKESLSMKFEIEDYLDAPLPRRTRSKDSWEIKWKLREKFNFTANAFDIRRRFLEIEAADQKGKKIGTMRINLYMIATGPYHHDFSFNLDKTSARLQFDLKISQTIETEIICNEAELELLSKEYPGETFNFSLGILKDENESECETSSSYVQKTPLQSTAHYVQKTPLQSTAQSAIFPLNQLDECPSPLRMKKKSHKFISSPKLSWDARKGEMPYFKIPLKSSEINRTLIHLIFWIVDQRKSESIVFIDSYLSFSKFFENNPKERAETKTNIVYEARTIKQKKQKMFKNGQQFAEYSLNLKIENTQQHIQQKQACARTENGIIPMNPYIKNYGFSRSTQTNKMATVCQIANKIEKINLEMNQLNMNFIEKRKKQDDMLNEFEHMNEILEKDLHESFAIPSNQQEVKDILQDQWTLLSILNKMFQYLEYDNFFSQISWKIIYSILERGEFQLNNIGFSKQDESELEINKSPRIQKKIKNAIAFQDILYRLFIFSLKIGFIEGRQSPNHVIQMFKAFCYFRIPQFREALLNLVVKSEDTELVELKIQNVEKEEGNLTQQNTLVLTIDWEDYFYRPLKNESQSQNLVKDLLQSLEGNAWMNQLSRRKTTFFYFVYCLIKRLEELGKKIKFMKWKYFPGYNKLVRSFLCEMKKKPVCLYPKVLIQTSVHLLSNEKLVNIIFNTIFEKTNLYDSKAVMKSLQLTNRYLEYLTREKKLLPPIFNYLFFFKALKTIIEGEFSYATTKALVIIYNFYLNFNVEFRKNITLYLLGKVFFKVFLHWSHPVRSTFYHLILLKFDKSADIFDSQSRLAFGNRHQVMNDISQRYEKVITIVRNAQIVKKNREKQKIFRPSEKTLFDKMRRKINHRRRMKTGGSDNQVLSVPTNNITETERTSRVFDKEKYSISELSRSDLDRSYSAIINIKALNLISRKKKDKEKDESDEDVPRIKSDTNYKDEDEEEEKIQHQARQAKKSRNRRLSFSFFGSEDFEIKEMEKHEFQYLGTAVREFNELEDAIKKYIAENQELPICELDKIQIPIDQKDFRPTNIQEWE